MVGKKSTTYLLKCGSWLISCLEGRRYFEIKLEGLASLVGHLVVVFLGMGVRKSLIPRLFLPLFV